MGMNIKNEQKEVKKDKAKNGEIKKMQRVVEHDKLAGSVMFMVQAILFCAMGIFVLCNLHGSSRLLIFVAGIFCTVSGVMSILSFAFIPQKRMMSTLMAGILYIVCGTVIFVFPEFIAHTIIYALGVWMFINFAWRVILCAFLCKDKDPDFLRTVFECFISLAACILIFVIPRDAIAVAYIILGIYLIFYGFTMACDAIREVLKWDFKGEHVRHKFKVHLPVLFTAFIPTKVFDNINESFSNPQAADLEAVELVKESSAHLKSDLEIFLHLSPKIAGGFGHCDICYKGTVYSYGTYDSASVRFFGTVSDGVFVKMPRDKYIDHCLKTDNENITGFTVYLAKDNEKNIDDYLEKFEDNIYQWKCKKELDPKGTYDDPASLFYETIGAKFYKFRKGKFKTYFAVKTNCVEMADTIVSSSGIDIISLNGIITPGTYFKYLDDMFKRENSLVIKKTVYAGANKAAK